jgi:hypothetical protein
MSMDNLLSALLGSVIGGLIGAIVEFLGLRRLQRDADKTQQQAAAAPFWLRFLPTWNERSMPSPQARSINFLTRLGAHDFHWLLNS